MTNEIVKNSVVEYAIMGMTYKGIVKETVQSALENVPNTYGIVDLDENGMEVGGKNYISGSKIISVTPPAATDEKEIVTARDYVATPKYYQRGSRVEIFSQPDQKIMLVTGGYMRHDGNVILYVAAPAQRGFALPQLALCTRTLEVSAEQELNVTKNVKTFEHYSLYIECTEKHFAPAFDISIVRDEYDVNIRIIREFQNNVFRTLEVRSVIKSANFTYEDSNDLLHYEQAIKLAGALAKSVELKLENARAEAQHRVNEKARQLENRAAAIRTARETASDNVAVQSKIVCDHFGIKINTIAARLIREGFKNWFINSENATAMPDTLRAKTAMAELVQRGIFEERQIQLPSLGRTVRKVTYFYLSSEVTKLFTVESQNLPL